MMRQPVRLGALLLLIGIGYLLVVGKLFYWQVVKAQEIKKIAQIQSTESLDLKAERGQVLFSDNFPIATNNLNYLVYANPKIISNTAKVAREISHALDYDEATVSARLAHDLFWVRLGVVNHTKKEELSTLELEGIGFEQEPDRYYPEASMAAHLIGFVGKNEDGLDQGYFGLEGYYDRQLRGTEGKLYVVKDALGNPIVTDIREEKKLDGRTIRTTIDRTAQFIASDSLEDAVEKYEAAGGSVIIMEPDTGKVIAMASYPKFDPENYYEYKFEDYQNPVVSSLYEPGSTFKVLVMAAAVNEGLVKADTRCTICAAPVEIGGFTIKTWNDEYHANTTMTEVIQHSDNTGMVFVGQKLGVGTMAEYIRQFGFGSETGIDLQGEVSGSVRRDSEWLPIDLATTSFGQGISVTPIQLLTAVNSIANGGYLMRPYVVDTIYDEEGKEIPIIPEQKDKILSSNTTEVMTWMMVNAVEEGDSKWVTLDPIRVAGKTGTAQIPVAGHYDPTQTIASFVGFFPAENPQISMLVLINRPQTSIYGSETAAPLFFTIAKELSQYYNIQPE